MVRKITINGVETTLTEGQQASINTSGEILIVEATHTLVALVELNEDVVDFIKGAVKYYNYDPTTKGKDVGKTPEEFAKLVLRKYGAAITEDYRNFSLKEEALKNIPKGKKVDLKN